MITSAQTPKIIFEDRHLLVIDKPAGLVVNRAQSVKETTLQDWVDKKFKIKNAVPRNGIVHRLDKDTSGLLLVAKDPETFTDLQSQFKKRKVEKKYLALAHGLVKPEKGMIDLPVGRNPFNRKKFACVLGGRRAETHYQVKKKFKKEEPGQLWSFSLLELFPRTGRTHQLRVHLKAINHPLVSDSIYAGRKTLRVDKDWCPRLFLHASSLAFIHPATGKKISFFSPLPDMLEQTLKRLMPL